MEINTPDYLLEIPEEEVKHAVEHLKNDVLVDAVRCPECGTAVKITVDCEERTTTTVERSLLLVGTCKAPDAACTWDHQILVGAAKILGEQADRSEQQA